MKCRCKEYRGVGRIVFPCEKCFHAQVITKAVLKERKRCLAIARMGHDDTCVCADCEYLVEQIRNPKEKS